MGIGPTPYEAPLLPFERELIETVGFTEDQYRKFVAEAKYRGSARPADYAHIPDVQASGAEPYLISLAISLVITGISYLIAPKPAQPSADNRKSINLGDINGPSRFTPSRGFETVAELADYQASIPLIFGRYDGTTGGMLVTPKLIWSRMFSYGTSQRAKLMFVVGEQGIGDEGITHPAMEGIFIGNNSLDALYGDYFGFYWKNDIANEVKQTILAKDKKYGKHGVEKRSELDLTDPIFTCRDSDEDESINFCHSFSPSNNTQFGCYAPIANGTGYRLNYEVVMVGDSLERNALRAAVIQRIKIAGSKNKIDKADQLDERSDSDEIRDDAQDSYGRNYSCRMGIIRKNAGVQASGEERFKEVSVEVDDQIQFLISHTSIPKNQLRRRGKGETVDDINSTVQSLQFAADDAMQVGEIFAIGGTVWRVTDRSLRSNQRFDPDTLQQSQLITLKCIETKNSINNKIGLVNKGKIIEPGKQYIGDNGEGLRNKENNIEETYFPIMKIATAIVRNNRPAVVTEIGIKSLVYQRLNGLCAFNALPTPDQIDSYQEDDLQVRTGMINTHIQRTSIFGIQTREAGTDNEFKFIQKNRTEEDGGGIMLFAIRGSVPVEQYNFIRFVLDKPRELEFKFVPIPGSEVAQLSNKKFITDLSHAPNVQIGSTLRMDTVSNIGMKVEVAGKQTLLGDMIRNNEFFRGPVNVEPTVVGRYPKSVTAVKTLPVAEQGRNIKSLTQIGVVSNAGNAPGKQGAFFYQLLEEAGVSEDRRNRNNTIGNSDNKANHIITRENVGGRLITIRWVLRKHSLRDSFYAKQNGIDWSWLIVDGRPIVKDSFAGFRDGEEVVISRGLQSTNADPKYPGAEYTQQNNPFKKGNPVQAIKWSGIKFKVKGGNQVLKAKGRIQAYRHEVFGDAQQLRRGTDVVKFVTLRKQSTDPNIEKKVCEIKLTSTVIKNDSDYFDYPNAWSNPVIEVVTEDPTTKNWENGETVEHIRNVSNSNPFVTIYKTAGVVYEINDVNTIKSPGVFEAEAEFAKETQISDISFYRSYVDKSNAQNPEHEICYINETLENEQDPTYENLTLAGLQLRAGRQFTALDQLRVWLSHGMQVERLHSDRQSAYGDNDATGPSNLFTDLVYYLMTNQVGGGGALLGMNSVVHSLVDKESLNLTSRFLFNERLFFNGAITQRTNLRQFIADTAPYFLCNFVITNGKFSLQPALPVDESGRVIRDPIDISQLFTSGNILENTFKIEYLSAEQRRPFKAVVRYRQERRNQFPEEKTLTIAANDNRFDRPNVQVLPVEQFDLTQFCTSKHHAEMVGRYFIALRQLVTHTISFETTLEGLNIKAGSFIKVITEASPYTSANNGTINEYGDITSAQALPDGPVRIAYFRNEFEDLEEDTMIVYQGRVDDTKFFNSIFTTISPTTSDNIYAVEQLTFSDQGTVEITASEYPCDDDDQSLLVQTIYNGSFEVTG